jgi:predicted DNA-binding transcriptional regulator YafY
VRATLVDGYETRLTGMTESEAEALSLSGLPAAAAELGLATAVAAAQLKLRAALPPRLRGSAARVADRSHLDARSWYQRATETPHLGAIATATWEQRRLRIRYERWAQPRVVDRTIEPYALVLKAGHWYVVARDDRGFRTYRITRVARAEVLAETFERTDGFDLVTHWHRYVDEFDERRQQGAATLRFSENALARLRDLPESAMAQAVLAAPAGTGTGRDGWTEVTIPAEPADTLVPELLRFGADVEVVSPPALRDHMVDAVRTLHHLYRQP